GLKGAAGRRLGCSQRITRKHISRAGQNPRAREALLQKIALLIDIGIDVMGDSAISLIFLKPIVVGGGAHPELLAPYCFRRLPPPQVVPDRGYLQRRSARKRQVLRSAE